MCKIYLKPIVFDLSLSLFLSQSMSLSISGYDWPKIKLVSWEAWERKVVCFLFRLFWYFPIRENSNNSLLKEGVTLLYLTKIICHGGTNGQREFSSRRSDEVKKLKIEYTINLLLRITKHFFLLKLDQQTNRTFRIAENKIFYWRRVGV